MKTGTVKIEYDGIVNLDNGESNLHLTLNAWNKEGRQIIEDFTSIKTTSSNYAFKIESIAKLVIARAQREYSGIYNVEYIGL